MGRERRVAAHGRHRLWVGGATGARSLPARGQPRMGRVCGTSLVVAHPRLVVAEEDRGSQVAAGSHAGLGEDPFEVLLHGVGRDAGRPGELGRGRSAQDLLGDLLLTFGEVMGRDEQGRETPGVGGGDDDGSTRPVTPLEAGTVEQQPATARRPDASGGSVTVGRRSVRRLPVGRLPAGRLPVGQRTGSDGPYRCGRERRILTVLPADRHSRYPYLGRRCLAPPSQRSSLGREPKPASAATVAPRRVPSDAVGPEPDCRAARCVRAQRWLRIGRRTGTLLRR
jgi:hypothetical protein